MALLQRRRQRGRNVRQRRPMRRQICLYQGHCTRTDLSFRTLAGVIRAQISGVRVKIRMTPPHSMLTDFTLDLEQQPFCLNFINTGVPHVVCLLESETALQNADIFNWGRGFRYHARFQPAGSNINFAFVRDPHHLSIRTYERGVEAETLACGTGSIAAALIAAAKGMATSPVDVQTLSGETLTIHFKGPSRQDTLEFEEVHLEGDARVVYEAELWDETLKE
jgi:diaminopimelate epimerase